MPSSIRVEGADRTARRLAEIGRAPHSPEAKAEMDRAGHAAARRVEFTNQSQSGKMEDVQVKDVGPNGYNLVSPAHYAHFVIKGSSHNRAFPIRFNEHQAARDAAQGIVDVMERTR